MYICETKKKQKNSVPAKDNTEQYITFTGQQNTEKVSKCTGQHNTEKVTSTFTEQHKTV